MTELLTMIADLRAVCEKANNERMYLVKGYEDTTQSLLCYESELLNTVLSVLFFDPKDCDPEERRYWETALADYDIWRCEGEVRVSFSTDVGEIGHVEIHLVTEPPESALPRALDALEVLVKELAENEGSPEVTYGSGYIEHMITQALALLKGQP